MTLVDNGMCGIFLHAVSDWNAYPLSFADCQVSGSSWAVIVAKHRGDARNATEFWRCTLMGTQGALRLPYDGRNGREQAGSH